MVDVLVHAPSAASRALVLLPGAQMHPSHVVQAGLPALLDASGVALDLYVPDLHIDPADGRRTLDRLTHEVLAPLRQRYQQLWLGGISLGGLLALHQAQSDASGLHGLCLLAPYPGSRLTTNAINKAGGLDAWAPTEAQGRDPEFMVWQGLRDGLPRLPCFMGYGEADRFADTMQPLAQRLPQACIHTVAGGHDWLAWLPLWQAFLGWLSRREGVQT